MHIFLTWFDNFVEWYFFLWKILSCKILKDESTYFDFEEIFFIIDKVFLKGDNLPIK